MTQSAKTSPPTPYVWGGLLAAAWNTKNDYEFRKAMAIAYPQLWRFAEGLGADEIEASQVVDRSLAKATQSLLQADDDGSPVLGGQLAKYILISIRWRVLNLRRRRINLHSLDGSQSSDDTAAIQLKANTPEPYEIVNTRVMEAELRRAIEELSSENLALFIVRFLMEMTLNDTSEILGLTLHQTRTRIEQIKQHFESRLKSRD